MNLKVYDINAKEIGEITLPGDVFSAKISDELVSRSIRAYLSNKRKAGAKAKNRAEVSGTTKKIWAQKGTGRARHGSAKAPIFVGGGVAHGPRGLQNFTKRLNKKEKALALRSLLSKFAKEKDIIVIDGLNSIKPKTKEGQKMFIAFSETKKELLNSKNIALVTSRTLPNVKRAFGNLSKVNLLSLKSLNTYDLSRQNVLIFSRKAIEKLVK